MLSMQIPKAFHQHGIAEKVKISFLISFFNACQATSLFLYALKTSTGIAYFKKNKVHKIASLSQRKALLTLFYA